MSTKSKKRFSIAPELASGIRSTMQSASSNQGQLHYDMMPLDNIEPDPQNPRKLLLTRGDILHGLNTSDPDYKLKMHEYDALTELAESIKKVGIRNAIEVYKDGLQYRIVTGERRYWAAIMADQKSVPVRITQKPDEFNLRYTQWVENINRQDLSLWEKLNNLILIADATKASNHTELTAKELQKLLGVSSIQAYRYFSLMNADARIVELVKLGKLNNLKLVQELVTMKDKWAQEQIIAWIAASKDEVTSLASFKEVAVKKTASSQSNRSQPISLGKVSNSNTAKHLFNIVLADDRFDKYRTKFKNIDWSSSKEITKAFKKLLNTIEKELNAEETA